MYEQNAATLFYAQGILDDVLRKDFRNQLPQLMERERQTRVQVIVTTWVDRLPSELQRQGSFFQPGRRGESTQFTWRASGELYPVLRQFRLDFVRHLSESEILSEVVLAIFREDALEKNDSVDQFAPPASPASPETATGPFNEEFPSPARSQDSKHPRIFPLNSHTNALEAPEPPAEETPPAARIIEALDEAPARAPESAEPFGETASPVPATPSTEPPRKQPLTGSSSRRLPGPFYQDYFGFEFMPFNNTPDTHFFFPTTKHQEALSRLIYAISERKGFVMISGEIGSGKSTLCRTLLKQLPTEVHTALITHTHLDAKQLIRAIAEDLGIDTRGFSEYDIHEKLNSYLIEQLEADRTVCIIIDEAQNLSPAALEEVRMISNLETENEKLVQLILLGQPELREKLRLPEMKQLRQRIAVQFHLEPLNRRETVGYIRHRLEIANPSRPLSFRRSAMNEVFRWSGGVPRLINTLCDSALLTAFTHNKFTITPGIIRETGRELELEPLKGGVRQFFELW